MKITIIIRWIATLIILVGIYTETGILTVISMTCCFIAIELICRIFKVQRELFKDIVEKIEALERK